MVNGLQNEVDAALQFHEDDLSVVYIDPSHWEQAVTVLAPHSIMVMKCYIYQQLYSYCVVQFKTTHWCLWPYRLIIKIYRIWSSVCNLCISTCTTYLMTSFSSSSRVLQSQVPIIVMATQTLLALNNITHCEQSLLPNTSTAPVPQNWIIPLKQDLIGLWCGHSFMHSFIFFLNRANIWSSDSIK